MNSGRENESIATYDVGKTARAYLLSVYDDLLEEISSFDAMVQEPLRYSLDEWDSACERLSEIQRQTYTLVEDLSRFGVWGD